MEITFKDGDRITIPEGCKATIDGNEVVIEKKKQEFKDGDILASTECAIVKTILIFKGKEPRKNSFRSHFNSSGLNEEGWAYSLFRYATDEEKQLLFDKMAEQGLRWNAKEKRVEKIRWRAVKGGAYYFFGTTGNVCRAEDDRGAITNHRYNAFNYFCTQEQAEKATEVVKEALKKFHEENE